MNFISNVLDAVPVVGHAKGIIHYACGDAEGGHNAMYQASRSTAVIGGGIAGGVIGGPAGAIGGAMYCGALTDTGASIVMGKNQGIIKQCENVGDDLKNGRNPTVSILSTGVHLGLDAVGGLGVGGLTSGAASGVGKKIATNVGEEIIEKTVKISAQEAAKFGARKVTETAVKKATEKVIVQVVSTSAVILDRALLETVQEEAEHKKKAERKRDKEQTNKNESKKKESTKENKEGKKKGEKTSSNLGTGSGSQPPKQNRGNQESEHYSDSDIFSDFLKLLEEILNSICEEGNGKKIYEVLKNLKGGQKNSLKSLIKKLKYFGILEAVLKLVILLFDQKFPSEFTFTNFLSLMEFVKTYINNKIEERSIISLGSEAITLETPFRQLTTYLINVITGEFYILRNLYDTFTDIQNEIMSENENERLYPDFNGIFSAVYHYFKHRIVPGDGIFSVNVYYNWIRRLLVKVKELEEYDDLCNRQKPNPRNQVQYELYVVEFGRRIKIVVKFQFNRIVLSTCYVVTVASDGNEGDVFIDGVLRKDKKDKKDG